MRACLYLMSVESRISGHIVHGFLINFCQEKKNNEHKHN